MLQLYLDPSPSTAARFWRGLNCSVRPMRSTTSTTSRGLTRSQNFSRSIPMEPPAAKDGDFALSESNAILQYAADLSGSDDYYPKDLKQRADVNRWLLWEGSTWFPSCYVYLVEYVVKPLMKAGRTRQ